MEKEKDMLLQNGTCPAIGYQAASICVPVTVTPFAEAGVTKTKCCGDPIVTSGIAPCPGVKNGACAFTISQNICVSVPIAFGAEAVVGDTYVDCGGATAQDICSGCDLVPPVPPVEPPVPPVIPSVPPVEPPVPPVEPPFIPEV